MSRNAMHLEAWGAMDPLAALASWPTDRPVMMLHSGRVHPRWARWSIIAAPVAWFRFHHGRSTLAGAVNSSARLTHDPLGDLDSVVRTTTSGDMQGHVRPSNTIVAVHDGTDLPFVGGWVGYFSYELGRQIEPRAQAMHHLRSARATSRRSREGVRGDQESWPLIELAYCPVAYVFDHLTRAWHVAGDAGELDEDLSNALQRATLHVQTRRVDLDIDTRYALGRLQAHWAAEDYLRAIDRALEYIAAGDIYQANIAQRFSSDFTGFPRALAAAAMRSAQPWYGAYLEGAQTHAIAEPPPFSALISLSPELFVELDPVTRIVTTRPIKGTRPASAPVRELIESAKDTAELHMIVDLMRNDLGRVCDVGTVEVLEPRAIETHPTVHQGVAEIRGRLREGVSAGDLLRATFPSGSVTGAPKIRAMQIIDELEPESRGPYCGAIGYISNCGRVSLSVAIRTMMLRGNRVGPVPHSSQTSAIDSIHGTLEYSAGGGIVAESVPQRELDECLVKCRVLADLVEASRPNHVASVTSASSLAR